jgi:hypothetical protein
VRTRTKLSLIRKRGQGTGAALGTPIPLTDVSSGGLIVAQSDPTDNALAAIASILDNPEPPREAAKPLVEEKPPGPEQIEAGGYSRVGPGPIASIRFKWTARRGDDGEYYVEETIGESAAVTSGPMSRDAAIKLVDDRESEARQRFENLRSEMTGRNAIASLVRKDSSEA